MERHVALYVRVSTSKQSTKSQEPELRAWAKGQSLPVKWYRDSFTGRTLDRPGWSKLQRAIDGGHVAKVAIWRMDRLGRSTSDLASLFADFQRRKIALVSLREGIDLGTPTGRMVAHVLASIAQFETELRGERVLAGQAVARAAGKRWGGSQPGVRKKVSPAQERIVRSMKADGESITGIASAVGLSRPTIYSILNESA